MKQYLDIARDILENGEMTHTRTGVNTIGVFGRMMKFDLREGFPIITTKRILWKTVVQELLWFIRGGHNINDDDAPKVIWDDWASPDGELGRIYGVEWRSWRGRSGIARDQLSGAIASVKRSPNNRRNIVSAWNVDEIENGNTNFPPCHVMFQLRRYDDRLDLAMYQRSCDWCLGVPFNISSYALLLTLIANECGLTPGIFTHFLGDAHIYVNHIPTLKKQLEREPYPLPTLDITVDNASGAGVPVIRITPADIHLRNYHYHAFLKYEIAV